jgi:hypothetical protein
VDSSAAIGQRLDSPQTKTLTSGLPRVVDGLPGRGFGPALTLAIFCGVGLLVSLVCASYGLDLSPGFF